MAFKKRIENFFYYYKWHTVAAIFVILILLFGIKSSIDSKEPDLNILYVSDKVTAPEATNNFKKTLDENKLIKDVNEDGEKYFYFEPLVLSFDDNSNQDYALYQKLQVQMFTGVQTLMLVHQYVLEDYDGAFDNIGAYAGKDDKTFKGSEKFVTGISVEGNRLLEDIGINTENLYVSMHIRTEKQQEKGELEKEYKLAEKVLEFILDNQ